MTLTELRYITAVAQHRHFGRAAEACFVSQPTLSVAVKKLEDELGVAIFERNKNEIAITPVGERIVAQARKTLEEAQVIKQIARADQDQLEGPFRLGAIFTVGPYLLPHILAPLRERAPELELILQEGYTDDLLEGLRSGELDAAVMALPVEGAGVQTRSLYDETFVVAVPSRHEYATKEQIGPQELSCERLLLLSAANCFREQVLQACPACVGPDGAVDGSLQRTLESSSLETIRQMTAAGAGITVLPGSAATPASDMQGMLTFKPFIDPAPYRRVVVAYRRSFPRSEAIDLLADVIQSIDLPGARMLPAETSDAA